MGGAHRTGYGVVSINAKQHFAHRLSYQVHKGEIPARLKVCHRCDNTLCINPDHLFLGTDADNAADKVGKGRQARGALHSEAIKRGLREKCRNTP